MSNPEPVYVRQAEIPLADRTPWLRECAVEAKHRGCTWMRATVHDDNEDLVVFEAWLEKPADPGVARFSLTYAK